MGMLAEIRSTSRFNCGRLMEYNDEWKYSLTIHQNLLLLGVTPDI